MSDMDDDAELQKMQDKGASQAKTRGGRKVMHTLKEIGESKKFEEHPVELEPGASPFLRLAKIADEAIHGKYAGYSQRKK